MIQPQALYVHGTVHHGHNVHDQLACPVAAHVLHISSTAPFMRTPALSKQLFQLQFILR
jgi:hypothetical protein